MKASYAFWGQKMAKYCLSPFNTAANHYPQDWIQDKKNSSDLGMTLFNISALLFLCKTSLL